MRSRIVVLVALSAGLFAGSQQWLMLGSSADSGNIRVCARRLLKTAFCVLILCLASVRIDAAEQPPEPQQVVYVSAARGSDHGRCSINSPCLSIQHALDPTVVQQGGTVVILDSGDYTPFSISGSQATTSPTVTSLTVEAAPGALAVIPATSGTAITIQSGSDDTVVLRGLTLEGRSAPLGIDFQTGRTLHVENCVINGFSSAGLLVNRNVQGDTAEVLVKDSTVRNGSLYGIFLTNAGSASVVKASVDNCRLERNGLPATGPRGDGLVAGDNAVVTVRNTVASNNGFGFTSFTFNSGNSAEMSLENCVAANNVVGIAVGSVGGSLIRLSNSTVTDNQFGLSIGPNGTILSRGNNTVEGNGSGNGVPPGSTFPPK